MSVSVISNELVKLRDDANRVYKLFIAAGIPIDPMSRAQVLSGIDRMEDALSRKIAKEMKTA